MFNSPYEGLEDQRQINLQDKPLVIQVLAAMAGMNSGPEGWSEAINQVKKKTIKAIFSSLRTNQTLVSTLFDIACGEGPKFKISNIANSRSLGNTFYICFSSQVASLHAKAFLGLGPNTKTKHSKKHGYYIEKLNSENFMYLLLKAYETDNLALNHLVDAITNTIPNDTANLILQPNKRGDEFTNIERICFAIEQEQENFLWFADSIRNGDYLDFKFLDETSADIFIARMCSEFNTNEVFKHPINDFFIIKVSINAIQAILNHHTSSSSNPLPEPSFASSDEATITTVQEPIDPQFSHSQWLKSRIDALGLPLRGEIRLDRDLDRYIIQFENYASHSVSRLLQDIKLSHTGTGLNIMAGTYVDIPISRLTSIRGTEGAPEHEENEVVTNDSALPSTNTPMSHSQWLMQRIQELQLPSASIKFTNGVYNIKFSKQGFYSAMRLLTELNLSYYSNEYIKNDITEIPAEIITRIRCTEGAPELEEYYEDENEGEGEVVDTSKIPSPPRAAVITSELLTSLPEADHKTWLQTVTRDTQFKLSTITCRNSYCHIDFDFEAGGASEFVAWLGMQVDSRQDVQILGAYYVIIRESALDKIRGRNFYIRNLIDPDGDCGYSALGITREDAYLLLCANLSNHTLVRILSPVVDEHLRADEVFQGYLRERGLTNCRPNDERVIREYLAYDILEKRTENGWAHPLVLHATAFCLNINLHIWEDGGAENSYALREISILGSSLTTCSLNPATKHHHLFWTNGRTHFDWIEGLSGTVSAGMRPAKGARPENKEPPQQSLRNELQHKSPTTWLNSIQGSNSITIQTVSYRQQCYYEFTCSEPAQLLSFIKGIGCTCYSAADTLKHTLSVTTVARLFELVQLKQREDQQRREQEIEQQKQEEEQREWSRLQAELQEVANKPSRNDITVNINQQLYFCSAYNIFELLRPATTAAIASFFNQSIYGLIIANRRSMVCDIYYVAKEENSRLDSMEQDLRTIFIQVTRNDSCQIKLYEYRTVGELCSQASTALAAFNVINTTLSNSLGAVSANIEPELSSDQTNVKLVGKGDGLVYDQRSIIANWTKNLIAQNHYNYNVIKTISKGVCGGIAYQFIERISHELSLSLEERSAAYAKERAQLSNEQDCSETRQEIMRVRHDKANLMHVERQLDVMVVGTADILAKAINFIISNIPHEFAMRFAMLNHAEACAITTQEYAFIDANDANHGVQLVAIPVGEERSRDILEKIYQSTLRIQPSFQKGDGHRLWIEVFLPRGLSSSVTITPKMVLDHVYCTAAQPLQVLYEGLDDGYLSTILAESIRLGNFDSFDWWLKAIEAGAAKEVDAEINIRQATFVALSSGYAKIFTDLFNHCLLQHPWLLTQLTELLFLAVEQLRWGIVRLIAEQVKNLYANDVYDNVMIKIASILANHAWEFGYQIAEIAEPLELTSQTSLQLFEAHPTKVLQTLVRYCYQVKISRCLCILINSKIICFKDLMRPELLFSFSHSLKHSTELTVKYLSACYSAASTQENLSSIADLLAEYRQTHSKHGNAIAEVAQWGLYTLLDHSSNPDPAVAYKFMCLGATVPNISELLRNVDLDNVGSLPRAVRLWIDVARLVTTDSSYDIKDILAWSKQCYTAIQLFSPLLKAEINAEQPNKEHIDRLTFLISSLLRGYNYLDPEVVEADILADSLDYYCKLLKAEYSSSDPRPLVVHELFRQIRQIGLCHKEHNEIYHHAIITYILHEDTETPRTKLASKIIDNLLSNTGGNYNLAALTVKDVFMTNMYTNLILSQGNYPELRLSSDVKINILTYILLQYSKGQNIDDILHECCWFCSDYQESLGQNPMVFLQYLVDNLSNVESCLLLSAVVSNKYTEDNKQIFTSVLDDYSGHNEAAERDFMIMLNYLLQLQAIKHNHTEWLQEIIGSLNPKYRLTSTLLSDRKFRCSALSVIESPYRFLDADTKAMVEKLYIESTYAPPLFFALKAGNLECARILLDAEGWPHDIDYSVIPIKKIVVDSLQNQECATLLAKYGITMDSLFGATEASAIRNEPSRVAFFTPARVESAEEGENVATPQI